ncbi:ankyrin repeat-containing domain protein [Kalaharituber pfeilii]|nr:ankyrin repeat-containing domain protein [Kalaharituber pfeilii]
MLVQAACVRSTEMIQLLATHPRAFLNPNAEWKDQRSSSWTALGYAAFEGNYDVFCALLELARTAVNKGLPDSCVNGSALCFAASGGLLQFMSAGRTWIHNTSQRSNFDGHVSIIRYLLSQFSAAALDPNHEDVGGSTPLHNAAASGAPVLTRALLDAGHGRIDPDRKSKLHGSTPLAVAAGQDNDEVVEMLLGLSGVDPMAKDAYGNTPLMYAAGNASERSLRILLTHPVARKAAGTPNEHGYTPLMALCSAGILLGHELMGRCLRMLLQMVPDVDLRARDHDGHTPLIWAAQAGNIEALDLLWEHARTQGQELLIDDAVNPSTGEVVSALIRPATRLRVDAVKWMVRRGAEAHWVNTHWPETGLSTIMHLQSNRRSKATRAKLNRWLVWAGAIPGPVRLKISRFPGHIRYLWDWRAMAEFPRP